MLSGLYPPTSGTATIQGCSITDDIEGARENLGICPQHDVLIDDLTVEEHLIMFANLKGATNIEADVEKMIQSVGLVEKRKERSKNLSGGQKRKLSVAIAFIGNSKVIILDEPTSGNECSWIFLFVDNGVCVLFV
jgi:ABC-type multidrug transport system ATPase subunit